MTSARPVASDLHALTNAAPADSGRRDSRRRSAIKLIAAAVVVQAMTGPGQTVGISVYVDHLVADLEISRSAVSTAYFIGTLLGAATLPVVGRFIDRRGARRAIQVFALAFGVALFVMSGAVGVVTLAIGFTLTRALGQGALTLAATTAVAIGFDGNRGTAIGIKSAASAALMSVVPLVATVLIGLVGWRVSWIVFALAVWVIVVPLTMTGALGRREHLLRAPPIGESTDTPNDQTPIHATPTVQIPTSAALRNWAFWSLTASVSISALVGTGLVFHHVSLLVERGLTPAQAAANFVPHTIAGAGAALAAGRLADRIPPRSLLVAVLSVLAATPILVQHVGTGASVVAYGLALGGTTAAIRSIEATVMPRWFGIANIGELRGIVMAASVAASAVGPLVLGLSADLFGGFQPGLIGFSLVTATLAVSAALTRPPPLSR